MAVKGKEGGFLMRRMMNTVRQSLSQLLDESTRNEVTKRRCHLSLTCEAPRRFCWRGRGSDLLSCWSCSPTRTRCHTHLQDSNKGEALARIESSFNHSLAFRSPTDLGTSLSHFARSSATQPFLQLHQLTTLRFAPFAHSRRTFFFNLPVLVLGSSSTISTSLGTMNLLMPLLCLAHSITSPPLSCLPPWTVTKAFGLSPQ